MLMGAVANMAPELFGGIIAEVPFVDVLTTMLDDTLPLTPPEWPEWGNPIASAKDYDIIAAYSPYDNVGAKAYPPHSGGGRPHRSARHLLGAGEMGGAAARPQDRRQPVLFKTNMDAGHGGASGRFSRLKEVAFVYAFAMKVAKNEAVS